MPFEISTMRTFSAAHALRLYDNSLEPVHGHNWRVRVTVGSKELDSIGVVMDFHELERRVDAIITPWHNRHLNECPPFSKDQGFNPSAENVALHIGRALGKLRRPAGQGRAPLRLVCVEVWETDTNRATYIPG